MSQQYITKKPSTFRRKAGLKVSNKGNSGFENFRLESGKNSIDTPEFFKHSVDDRKSSVTLNYSNQYLRRALTNHPRKKSKMIVLSDNKMKKSKTVSDKNDEMELVDMDVRRVQSMYQTYDNIMTIFKIVLKQIKLTLL